LPRTFQEFAVFAEIKDLRAATSSRSTAYFQKHTQQRLVIRKWFAEFRGMLDIERQSGCRALQKFVLLLA